MIRASDEEIIELFTQVHGTLSSCCHAEVIHDENFDVIGAACVKGGREVWRATLVELVADYLIEQLHQAGGGE